MLHGGGGGGGGADIQVDDAVVLRRLGAHHFHLRFGAVAEELDLRGALSQIPGRRGREGGGLGGGRRTVFWGNSCLRAGARLGRDGAGEIGDEFCLDWLVLGFVTATVL